MLEFKCFYYYVFIDRYASFCCTPISCLKSYCEKNKKEENINKKF